MTTKEFVEKTYSECPFFKEIGPLKISEQNIHLYESQIEAIISLLTFFCQNNEEIFAQELFQDIIKEPQPSNGKIYEALAYSWLHQNNISFTPQPKIAESDCLKKHGYCADGKIENVIFDIKQFGIGYPHIETLRNKIQEKIPDCYIGIGGNKSISFKDVSKLLERIDDIVKELHSDKTKIYTDHIYKIDDLGIEIRSYSRGNRLIISSISEFDIYEWAQNNETYFLKHGSQFCANDPYVIFCPFDKQINLNFAHMDASRVSLYLRPLCRRIFMNLTKMDNKFLREYDGKAKNDVTVAFAARKISAIVFLDVTEKYSYDNCRAWAYINPNADNKLYNYQISHWFRNANAFVDEYRYDNY